MAQGNRSLHAMLITRLLIVTGAIAIVVALFVVVNERSRILKVAMDRALIRTGTLGVLIQEQLDTPGLGDHSKFPAMLKAIGYKGFDLNTGHYVFLRIIDLSGKEVARTIDQDYDHMATLVQHVDTIGMILPSQGRGLEVGRMQVGNTNYLHAWVPLHKSQGGVAAYLEGFFATSRDEERKMLLELLGSVGLALGMVIVTGLLLYPVILRLMRRLGRLSHSLLESNLEILRVVGSTIAKRDSDTDIHNFRVTIYSVRIAEALGLDDQAIRVLIRGAFLHDVGKIGIRDQILLKPGKLDEEEFAEMKKHVDHGIDIVTRSSWLGEAVQVVGRHHEKFEGNGYPTGLKGADIPILARIFAIADVFDALISHRPYKEALSFDETIDILIQGRGTHFDPEILDLFVKMAKPLFDLYGNRRDDKAYSDLSAIIDRYYKADIATFLD